MVNSIEALELSRVFTGPPKRIVQALDRVNLNIKEGEVFGLLGPNGAGKTTLIKILTTLLLPTSGRAYVCGLDIVDDAPEVRRSVNSVSGGEAPGYGVLTVKENLWFFSQLYGLPGHVSRRRIGELMEQLDLLDYANVRLHKLSTGYRQRLNLARGFINYPSVLFIDEPSVGLDVVTARHIRRYVKAWVRGDRGRTVLLTTHYMAEADELCDRVAIIDQGRIMACDRPQSLKGRLPERPTIRVEVVAEAQGFGYLKGIPGVMALSEGHDMEGGMNTLRIVIEEDSVIPEIIRALSERGARVLSLDRMKPTLEEVYVSLVGRGLEKGV